METMLEVQSIRCGYGGAPVVKDISFSVAAGEKLCILGPNGCGKTTLLRAIAGLLPYDGGVFVAGTDLRGLSPKKRAGRLALMSQLAPAAFDYTVYECVMLGRYAHQKGGLLGRATAEDRAAVEESLVRTDTWQLRERLVTQLSGGQLQRVFLARVFAQAPQVILLDEPTNHLDLRCQVALIDSLNGWAAQGGRCVVGVFHDMNLALSFADRALLMAEGETVVCQDAAALDLTRLNDLYGMDVKAHMLSALQRWQ